jgi:short-subunit dehydrogenase
VITGASSGIGAAFARKLARQGYHLVLAARRQQRLEQLRDELTDAHAITVEIHVADLADSQSLESLAVRVTGMADLELLVNNAGFGTTGDFAKAEIQQQLDMIRVHVLASVRLTHAALSGMIERDSGAVINVSSIGAWLPLSGNAQYAATKMYLNTFCEAVQDELRGTGARVQALCPGFTITEFHDGKAMQGFDRTQIAKGLWMAADDVVDYSLQKLNGRQTIVIPGWRNRVLARILRTPILQPLVRAVGRYKMPKD